MTAGSPPKQNVLLLKLQFPVEYGLFVGLNLLDLFLTMLFIERGGGEANPAAKYFLLLGGKTAFIAYKVVLTLLVIALCEVVAAKRRPAARAVIWVGIVLIGAVVVMSAWRFYANLTGPA